MSIARTRSLGDVARDLEPGTDLMATIAACAVIPVLVIEAVARDGPWADAAVAANWLIWSAFLGDALAKGLGSGRRWLHTSAAWFDVGLVVLTFPVLGQALAAARLLRLGRASRALRTMRLLRLAAVAPRAWTGLRRVLDPASFPFVMAVVVMVVATGSGALFVVEFQGEGVTAWDALWWAVTTVTTVGYGDLVPKSAAGRAVAIAVMFVGIAFTSLLTAQIAAYLARVNQERVGDDLESQLRALSEKVERLTDLVIAMRDVAPGDRGRSSDLR